MRTPRSLRRVVLASVVLALAPAGLASAAEADRGDAVCTIKPVTIWVFNRTITTPAIVFPCP